MGRLKARLARNQYDRELHSRLADATRSLSRALDVCRRAGSVEGVEGRRAKQSLQRIGQALRLIEEIGHLVPSSLGEDLDLMKEEELSRRAREARKARKEALVRKAQEQRIGLVASERTEVWEND